MLSPSTQDQIVHIPYHAQLNSLLIETKLPIFKQLKRLKGVPNHQKSHRDVLIGPLKLQGTALPRSRRKVILQTVFFPSNCLVKNTGFNVFSFIREATCSPSGRLLLHCNSSSWRAVQAGLEVAESLKNLLAWQCRGNLIAASCIQGISS